MNVNDDGLPATSDYRFRIEAIMRTAPARLWSIESHVDNYHCGKGTKPTGMFFVWHSLNVTRMRLPIITCSFSPRNKAVALLSAVNSRSINSSKEYSGLKRSSSTSAASPRKRICDEERGKAVEYSWQALDSKNIFWTLRFIARTSRVYFTLSLHS